MSPKDVMNYLEKKVVELPEFNHRPDQGKVSFFVIDDPYDFDEFDNALRNCASFPAVLCELTDGHLADNHSGANFTNSISVSFMILDAQSRQEKRIDTQSRCFELGTKLLGRIRKDSGLGVFPEKRVTVEMNSNYQPVGPLNSQYWGYQFDLNFIVNVSWC